MDMIEVVDFHQEKEVAGIRFTTYPAGHVLGACMFMIEIAGVKVQLARCHGALRIASLGWLMRAVQILYTGDYSRQEDRHLCAAEIPPVRPDVLIVESTYGVQNHPPRVEREAIFTNTIRNIVRRGGRCLIPVFALGRAQELLLILDEYWEKHPDVGGARPGGPTLARCAH